MSDLKDFFVSICPHLYFSLSCYSKGKGGGRERHARPSERENGFITLLYRL